MIKEQEVVCRLYKMGMLILNGTAQPWKESSKEFPAAFLSETATNMPGFTLAS